MQSLPALVLSAYLIVGLMASAYAQSTGSAPSLDGPAPPGLPATIARDDQGRAAVRAVRLTAALRLDGRLDESIYASIEPMSDFIQMEPDGGQPATEKTEVWLFFDDRQVYVCVRVSESDPERRVANEMRRDNSNVRQGDHIGFAFDTFFDRRNAVHFEVNSLGARADGQSTNERQYNGDWNPIWDLAVRNVDGGWSVETAIPFTALRFRPGVDQIWGFNVRRVSKSKNEISYLVRVPPALGFGRGNFSASLFATTYGLEAPPPSRTLELKPYIVGSLTTDRVADTSDRTGDVGVDAKYAITQNLTADLTINTDFAQVEADEQQVNLTRFSLFFPEKRDFFLENQGTFSFGGVGTDAGDTPVPFYSRRIGLSQGRDVPILGGGRITGRAGRFTIGLLDIHTRADEAAAARPTNFSVVRVKADLLRRSSLGALVTNRSISQSGRGSNQLFGMDGTFSFFANLSVNTYWTRTRTTGREQDDGSYRAQIDYAGDRYGVQLERLSVGANFNPEVGYVRRSDMRRDFAQFRFSPRPKSVAAVRKVSSVASLTYIEDGAGVLESRLRDGEFAIELQNSDRFSVGLADDYEYLKRPFAITSRASIATGGYQFTTGRVGYNLGQQRRVSGNVALERGSFYDGRRTALTLSRSRLNMSPRLSAEPSLSVNWIDLRDGSFTTTQLGSRFTFTMTPLMFTSALVQYNSGTHLMSVNVRLRWEYALGSELFIVVNEERDSQLRAIPVLQNRSVIVKVTRWLRR